MDACKRELLKQEQRWRYAGELRDFEPLSDVRREEVVSRVAELLPTIRHMMHSCEEVWRTVRPVITGDDNTDTPVAHLAVSVHETAHDPLFRAANALVETVHARGDRRALLVCFYVRYREWRDSVHRMGRFEHMDVPLVAGYSEWWRYDDKWRGELVQKVAAPNLALVRHVLAEYNQEHGDLVAMPKPDKPYTGPTQQGPNLR